MQVTLTNRSFSTQLMAVITVGMMTISLGAISLPTGVSKPPASLLKSMSAALNQGTPSTIGALGTVSIASYLTLAKTMKSQVETFRNKPVGWASLTDWMRNNSVTLKNRKLTDTDAHNVGESIQRDFGFVDSQELLKRALHRPELTQNQAIDRLQNRDLNQQLLDLETGYTKVINYLTAHMSTAPIMFLNLPQLDGATCRALNIYGAAMGLYGLSLNAFGGPETPWAWAGDGAAIGGATVLLFTAVFC